MARETQEAIAVQSSIVLLQNRFKKLHRVAREREERQNLKKMRMLNPQSDQGYSVFSPSRAPLMLSLSLWPPSSQSQRSRRHVDRDNLLQVRDAPAPLMKTMRLTERLTNTASNTSILNKLDDYQYNRVGDVDTSLHL